MFSHVSFTSVPVDDMDRALGFYRDSLGMDVAMDAKSEFGRWLMLSVPGAETKVHLDQRPDGAKPPERPVLVLIAPDLAGACASLEEKGVELLVPPGPAEWNPAMDRAIIRDSEGNLVLLTTP